MTTDSVCPITPRTSWLQDVRRCFHFADVLRTGRADIQDLRGQLRKHGIITPRNEIPVS